ncbi:Serine phosphatase RsbU, regulator of sigma subunit [Actinacidiphila yanglinensis]|uniref:Serine phosphatase RsbU, regulator of sigma subunit n=2 Tax=Actinacidiphila yanglinensis TaxID=310779 RepID=A0A1H6CP13_9ACTN|nr:Serine phosphatase RsbU, regulator of sigma subunit [Actinacidiphila yanglinensis]
MNGSGHDGGIGPAGASDALRLAVLDAAEGLGEADVLRLAVQQCVAALGGIGGLAHLAGREHGSLRLAAAGGVPDPVARAWERVEGPGLAPVRAVERRRVQWSPRWPDGQADRTPRGGANTDRGGRGSSRVPDALRACGVLSAPILVDGTPIGVLSVLAEHEPAPDRQQFLVDVAALAAARLPVARRWRSGTTPWWQLPQGVRGQVMHQISVGTWTWDLDTGLLDIDEVTEGLVELAGLDPDTWDHRIESWMERIHPEDRPGVDRAIDESLASGQPYAVEYRVLDESGRVNWLELRGAFEHDENGRPVRMVGTAWNVTTRRSQLEWLAGLLELNPDPIHVVGADNRVQWANQAARELGGAAKDIVGRTPWDAEPLLRDHGLPELLDRARAAPGSAATTEVAVNRRTSRGSASFLVKAVEIGGFVSITMSDTTEQRRAEHAAAERGRRVADLNAALVRALNTEDVVTAIVQHVPPLVDADGLVVHDLSGESPRLVGDTGFSAALVDDLHELRLRLTAEYREEGTATGGPTSPVNAVYAAGGRPNRPRFLPDSRLFEPVAAAPGARPDMLSSLLGRLAEVEGVRAWAVLPLVVGDYRLGSCVIGWNAPRTFTEDDKTLLGTVGVILAQALGNARLYESARHRAERLQQELLPGNLPVTTALRAVARYRTADGQELGGDWYDTIPLSGGRTLVVIGDVMGHGLEQAIAMGIIRHAVLTVAALDLPVDEIVARLNDVVVRLAPRIDDPVVCATCLLALYDPTTGACSIASAGHAAPIALEPGGTPHRLTIPTGPPLGMAQLPAQITEATLAEGTVLLLYTDGLLGSHAPDSDELTEVVAQFTGTRPAPAAGEPAGRWLTALCETVTGQLPPDPRRQDDAVLLALSTGRVPADRMASWDLPWAPESAGRARELASEQLAAWGLADLAEVATLIISELIGNTVRHAVGLVPEPSPADSEVESGAPAGDDEAEVGLGDLGLEGGLGLHLGLGLDQGPEANGTGGEGVVRLRLLHIEQSLVCEVYDGSQATPRVRHPLLDDEFGRGLQLVAMMSGRWGTRYTENGKCIWARLEEPHRPDGGTATMPGADRSSGSGPDGDTACARDAAGDASPGGDRRPAVRRAAG